MIKWMEFVLKKVLPILFLVGLAVVFYWKFFLKGLVPFPGDLMVGAYFPWLEYKWGNVVGVAVKNTFISDIFSEFYVEKVDIVRSYFSNQWPIWDPKLYSGFPLFASFNTGALNPFNLLLIFFGNIKGWSLLVISQALFSSLSMYFLLKKFGQSVYPALVGAIVYAFGGFAMTWSQFVNAGYVMAWLPLIFWVIEQAKQSKNNRVLLSLTPLFFLTLTAGHFQGLFYTAVLSCAYFIYRFRFNNKGALLVFISSSILAIGVGALQILPTVELLQRSIRFDDGMIREYNFGLLPKQNIMTMIAPDYFGNPSTGNFWGFYNYHETIAYLGIIGLLALIYSLFNYKKLSIEKFFVVSTVLALLIQFDTLLGKAIYAYKFPFLSTFAAGRIGVVVLFGVAILTGTLIENINKLRVKEIIKIFTFPILAIIIGFVIPFFANRVYTSNGVTSLLVYQIRNNSVALRNLVIPTGIILLTLVLLVISRKIKFAKYLIIVVVIGDLFRFGWKYLPFVPENYIFPRTQVTDFLKSDNSVFRVDKELAEILPPNTWMGYDLSSPSGFDPLAIENYVRSFNRQLNMEATPGASRYNELRIYDAGALGNFNVKYLLAIKRDEKAVVPGNNINYRINEDEWKRVFQTPAVAVLFNTKYKERARVVKADGTDAEGSATIISYENNRVVVSFINVNGEKLLLADTYYPGWVATIDGKETKIGDEIAPFRTVDIRGMKTGQIVFEYKPKSFAYGLLISGVSFAIWLVLVLLRKK